LATQKGLSWGALGSHSRACRVNGALATLSGQDMNKITHFLRNL